MKASGAALTIEIRMETAPRLYHVLNRASDRNPEVEAYFDTLRKEQARFLDAIAGARSLLNSGSGQLAQLAATQGLLTRQFLDAQRSIMRRRAEIDAEIAMIVDESAGLAAGMVDSRPLEPRTIAAQRQLASLLDDWWRIENQDGRAAVDAVRGRATVEPSAGPEVCQTLPPPVGVPVHGIPIPARTESTTCLPSEMLTALESVEPGNLLSLLTTLADSLAPRPAETELRQEPPVDDLVIRPDPAPIGISAADSFDEFWDERSILESEDASPRLMSAARRAFRSTAAHVVLPMTVVTSALVLLMVWVG